MFSSPPIGGEVAVRGILPGTTLTLALSLQRRERRLAGSDEAHSCIVQALCLRPLAPGAENRKALRAWTTPKGLFTVVE